MATKDQQYIIDHPTLESSISPPSPSNTGTIINTNSAPQVDNSGIHSDVKTQSAATGSPANSNAPTAKKKTVN